MTWTCPTCGIQVPNASGTVRCGRCIVGKPRVKTVPPYGTDSPYLDNDQVEARLAICRACPEGYFTPGGFCRVCPSCQSKRKENFDRHVRLRITSCPRGHWPVPAPAPPPAAAEHLAEIGPAAASPLWRRRFDASELLPADHCFNPSIASFAGKVYFAYRRNWGRGRIVLAELDARWRVRWQKELDLPLRDRASVAHEDPRLFVHDGALHVAYTGCYRPDRVLRTSVCYARLSEAGDVLADYQPRYAGEAAWEKNWSFFESDGLHAIYWHGGHRRILRIDGDRAELIHEYQQELPFAGGEPRGGASPILHNGEWYVFFHGVAGEGIDRIYSAGLYTFDPEPPFRIRRFIRQPLLLPNLSERPVKTVPHCVYPAGAMLHDGQWIIALGNYDHWCELAALDAEDVEGLLCPL